MRHWQCFLPNFHRQGTIPCLWITTQWAVEALRTVLLEYKESGELHEAYKEQIQSTLESDNPWVAMMMKSIGADPTIKKSMTDEAIDGMIDSMLGAE